jgi:histidine triad (HIT) family protein
MYHHAPPDYDCPFCRVAHNRFTKAKPITRPEDVVFRTSLATVFIASHSWPNNRGHVLIIPNQHFENIYELPLEYATEIHRLARATALAMKTVYGCEGTSTRQHNEPAGGQDVWHYHLHVYPRNQGDNLYLYKRQKAHPEERKLYARELREYFAEATI